MPASKLKRNISPNDLEETEAAAMDGQKQADSRRRFADSLKAKSRKLKLDRRVEGTDRRTNVATGRKGLARRKTLDRRESLNDRRDDD